MKGGTWYNTYISKKLHGKLFEVFVRNARTDRYNIMCSIDAHEKEHQSSFDYSSSGEGCPLPSNSTIEALDFLGTTIDFIGCWIKSLEHNFIERFNMYVFTVICFRENPVKRPNKPQIIITCYLRWLACEQIRSESTTTKEK